MYGNILYGYNINNSFEFRVDSGFLMNINDGRIIKLDRTDKMLLHLFIKKAPHGWISDDDIAEVVFEQEGLKSSSSRLRGVIRNLKGAFIDLGCHKSFISRNNRRGYYLHFDKVIPLIVFYKSI